MSDPAGDPRPAADGDEPPAAAGHGGPGFGVPAFDRATDRVHPIRRAVLERLKETPGWNKNQLAEELGISPNLLQFHLEKLQDIGVIVTRPGGQGREVLCFLVEDEGLWEEPATRVLYGREPIRSVAIYVAEHPKASTRQIAEALGIGHSTVRHHLRTLRKSELVLQRRAGRTFLYLPAQRLLGWMEEVGHRFGRPWKPAEPRQGR